MESLNRKYVATLALIAFLILAIGLLIRPRDTVQVPLPVAEAAPLQQLSHERDLRAQARYLAERINAVAPQTVYLADLGVSGVRWDSTSLIVTTLPAATIATAAIGQPADTIPAAPAAEQPERIRWVIAVARRPDGSTVSAVALNGGLATVQCNESMYQEMILDVQLHSAFAGGGLFDLSGNRLGLIAHCADRFAALPVDEVKRALGELNSPASRLKREIGLVVAALEPHFGRYFQSDSGVIVVEVQQNGLADTWDVRPGDIIESINGRSVRNAEDLQGLLDASATQHVIVRIRAGRRTQISLPANRSVNLTAPAAIALTSAEGWTTITSVAAGSLLYRAGLRAGDRVVQVENVPRPNPAFVQRALDRTDTMDVFIVVERGSTRRGLLISAR